MEKTESQAKIGGVFKCAIRRNGKIIDEWEEKNIVVNEGLNYLLDAAVAGNTVVTTWYIGLLNNYTPVAGSTMANFGSVANENVAYSEAVRQTYTIDGGAAASQQVTNSSANRATFTANGATTVYGAFLTSVSTKNSTSGTALCGAQFSASKTLASADELLVQYTLTAADA